MRKNIFNAVAFVVMTLVTATLIYCSEIQQQRINDFSGGMVTNSLPDILQLNQFTSLVNVVIKPGKISKRKGQLIFNKDTGHLPFYGIGRYDPDANTSYMMAASDVSIVRSEAASTYWTLANPYQPLTSGQDVEFIQADDLLFIINGFDSTGWYNGTSFATSVAYPTSPPTATTGAWMANYLFLAGATDENDWLYVSTNLEPTSFPSTYIKKINTGDGQKIMHVEPFKINELIVYKERSIFIVDITEAPDSTLSTWTVQPISTVIGCIAPRSVVSLGNDQWFLSSEPIAVRSLVRSQFDKILVDMVSQPIQDVFDGTGTLTINKTHIDKAASVLFDNKFFLAIPTGASTVNNTVFVYDFLIKSWYRIDGWYPVDWLVFDDNRLFYIDANDGSVVECFASSTADVGLGPYTLDDDAEPQEPIRFEVITKTLDFDRPELYKRLDALEVEFDPTGDYTADVYVNLDNNGWENVGSVNLAGNSTTLNITLPSILNNAGVANETFLFDTTDEYRKMQVRVSNQASSQNVTLQRMTVFSDYKPWRRME